MVDVLLSQDGIYDEDEINDFGPLTGDSVPEWVRRLTVLEGWRMLDLPPDQAAAVTRLAVAGPRPDGSCEATETLSVFGYTGWAGFDEVLSGADRSLQDLDADHITSRVLRLPPVKWAVAVQAEGVAMLGERRMWMRQSNYLIGSMSPHAGRLFVHSVIVDDAVRQQWAQDVDRLCEAVHHGFVASLNPDGAQSG
jgi:hypothetical protein